MTEVKQTWCKRTDDPWFDPTLTCRHFNRSNTPCHRNGRVVSCLVRGLAGGDENETTRIYQVTHRRDDCRPSCSHSASSAEGLSPRHARTWCAAGREEPAHRDPAEGTGKTRLYARQKSNVGG